MNLYNRIDELRKRKGITWKHINEKVDGTYRGRMTEFKNGKTSFSHEQLETIAKILDTSTDYLLGRTDDPRPVGEGEQPAPITESRPQYPLKYDLLTPANKAFVDRLIEELVRSQSPE